MYIEAAAYKQYCEERDQARKESDKRIYQKYFVPKNQVKRPPQAYLSISDHIAPDDPTPPSPSEDTDLTQADFFAMRAAAGYHDTEGDPDPEDLPHGQPSFFDQFNESDK